MGYGGQIRSSTVAKVDRVRQGIGLQPHDVRAFHHLDADPGVVGRFGGGFRPAGDRG